VSPAVVVSSVSGRCLPVMLASCREYAPAAKVYLRTPVDARKYDVYRQLRGPARSFGADYNDVIDAAFADGHKAVVVANDDVVLTPTSYEHLLEDVMTLQEEVGEPIGWVCARCDASRPMQNIRSNPFNQDLNYFRFPWEDCIAPMQVISPIFGYISRVAWEVAKFPPLNWYSDDVHCQDLEAAGFKHFLSRSYVHHVGSQSTGMDGQALTLAAVPWIRANRPEYANAWFGVEQ
jgi:hypothetical protein